MFEFIFEHIFLENSFVILNSSDKRRNDDESIFDWPVRTLFERWCFDASISLSFCDICCSILVVRYTRVNEHGINQKTIEIWFTNENEDKKEQCNFIEADETNKHFHVCVFDFIVLFWLEFISFVSFWIELFVEWMVEWEKKTNIIQRRTLVRMVP